MHSVVLEAVPLYDWHGQTVTRPLFDAAVWRALETLDPRPLGAALPDPEYFSVTFSPYAAGQQTGSFATFLWRRPALRPFDPAPPVQPLMATDLSRLLSRFLPLLGRELPPELLGGVIAHETAAQYPPGRIADVFPGTLFGPPILPEGNGRSTEIVVEQRLARTAVQITIETLQREAAAGRHLVGALAVRFVPATRALWA